VAIAGSLLLARENCVEKQKAAIISKLFEEKKNRIIFNSFFVLIYPPR
jgi:hypothetical protein